MKVSEKIDSIQEKVRELLEKYEQLRDDDKMLWLAFLNIHLGLRKNINEADYLVLKKILLDSNTPSSDTITRARRKIQEQYPSLQGEKRKVRKEEAEDMREWARNS